MSAHQPMSVARRRWLAGGVALTAAAGGAWLAWEQTRSTTSNDAAREAFWQLQLQQPEGGVPMADIAQQIRDARTVRGWSQEDLASQAGLSRPSIARIERGDDVSTATLSKVAVVLGLTIRIES